jgi:hypothetical protein
MSESVPFPPHFGKPVARQKKHEELVPLSAPWAFLIFCSIFGTMAVFLAFCLP